MEAWLCNAGAVGLDDLEIADFPVTGRGVRAKRPFKQGDRILTIPASCLWTVEHAYADPLLGPVLRSVQPSLSVEDTLALYILFVRSRPAQDPKYQGLQKHVAAMPSSYSMSIFFTDDELEVCAGSSLYTLTTQLRGRVGEDYKQLLLRVLTRHRQLFPLDKFSIRDYQWALCTIWSRGMDFAITQGNSVRLVAPFADMFNHSPHVKQCHAYDPSTGDLTILAGKDYEIGDQVFIYYGPVPNSRLLRLYGFVMPENANDNYDLVLQTSPLAPLYELKERLWTLAGLELTSTIPLTLADPLPNKLFRYLRIQRLDESDLGPMTLQIASGKDEKISDANETQVLEFLIGSFQALLASFGTPLETLEAQLSDGGVYPPGSNSWAAAQVSVGEQRVLRLASQKAENLLAAVTDGGVFTSLPSQCARCGSGSAAKQLMACGRCKSVKYCSRECQVAHFKEHKVLCRSLAAAK